MQTYTNPKYTPPAQRTSDVIKGTSRMTEEDKLYLSKITALQTAITAVAPSRKSGVL